MRVGQVYCLFAGKSCVKACMASKRNAPNDFPGPAPRAQPPRAAPRAQWTFIPEPANEPIPADAPIPAGAALAEAAALARAAMATDRAAALAQAATATDPDEVVVIDPAVVTPSRRESQRLRSSGEMPKFELLLHRESVTSKVK